MGADNNNYNKAVSLSARSRPQYHYFYGSTEEAANIGEEIPEADHDDSLFGEELVPTDREDEPPTSSERDLPHLIITNGESSKPPSRDRSYPVGLVPVSILILAVVMLVVVVFPIESGPPMPAYGFVPYTHVDRSEFGDPVASFISMELFHPTLLSDTIPRTFKFPFPTGAFWTNLVVLAGEDIQSYPIVVYPYSYKWADSSLQLSYPAARRLVEKLSIQDAFEPDITISTEEDAQHRYITKFDPLSVTLRFVSTPGSKWETSLVQGSPYATIKVLNSTPVFTPLSTFKSVQCPGDDNERFGDFAENEDDGGRRRRLFGVCSIDESDEKKTTIRGVQFMFKTAEGLSWIMFSSEPMNLEFDTARKTTIKSSAPFTGIIRLAHIPSHIPEMNPNETTADPIEKTADSSTGLRRLIYHAGAYPTGGQVSWEFHPPLSSATGTTSSDQKSPSSGRLATVTFKYATQTMLDTSHIPLLMLALPHHADVLSASVMLQSNKFDLVFHSIKGPLTPVVGSTWSYTEPLLDIGIDGPFQEIDPRIRRQLLEQIDDDLGQLLPTSADNIYGFGKQIARLAQLTHIAKKLHKDGDQNNGFQTGIPEKGTALLSNYLEMFLSSQVTDKLVFDSNLGGLVSNNGLLDTGEDFGNGRYNDHHFHYGYILYACSIMGRLDPSFLDRFGQNVDAIFHDVAHPLNSDSSKAQPSNLFFPLARHKSWFDGHSFATGLFPFATGKSQESSSEAVNCYYGAYLWSLVRHGGSNAGSDLIDFTRLLLAMEIRSTKAYWHMIPPTATNASNASEIYAPEFQENYMVGNVGMLDVEASTQFGGEPLYVHTINALPITAITAKLFDRDYVQYEYPFLMKSSDSVEMAWRGYTVSIHAIIDPATAWKEARELVSWELDSGLSKSQVLYWICQRPSFTNSTIDVD